MPRRPPVAPPRVPVPEAPQVPTPGGGGATPPRSGLGKKIGPLPAWAWGAIIVGMIAFVYIVRKGTSKPTGQTDREVLDEEGRPITPETVYVPTYPGDRPPTTPPGRTADEAPREPPPEDYGPEPTNRALRSLFDMGGGPPNQPANGIVPSEIFGYNPPATPESNLPY